MTLAERLTRAFLDEHPGEAAQELERLPPAHRIDVIGTVPDVAARAVQSMTAAAAADTLERLDLPDAAAIVEGLSINASVALLRRLPPDVVDRLLGGLPPERRESLDAVLRYPEGTAGALMDPVVFALPDDITVGEARERLRHEARGLLYYVFIVDRSGTLIGVLDIPELFQAGEREPIRAVMHSRVESLPAWTPATAVSGHPGWRAYHAMPVTDDDGRLVGAIRYQTMRRLEGDSDTDRGARNVSQTVGALGELFHLGMAGIVEGVATAATPRNLRRSDGGGR